MNRLIAVLVTAILVVPGGAAIANPFASSEASFRYTDLDLTTADGQSRLNSRLTHAAEAVCGRGMDRIHLQVADQARACKADVIAATRARIDQRMAARDGGLRPASTVVLASR